jgi:hypothetical protein
MCSGLWKCVRKSERHTWRKKVLLPWSPPDKGTSLSQHHSVNFTKGKLSSLDRDPAPHRQPQQPDEFPTLLGSPLRFWYWQKIQLVRWSRDGDFIEDAFNTGLKLRERDAQKMRLMLMWLPQGSHSCLSTGHIDTLLVVLEKPFFFLFSPLKTIFCYLYEKFIHGYILNSSPLTRLPACRWSTPQSWLRGLFIFF